MTKTDPDKISLISQILMVAGLLALLPLKLLPALLAGLPSSLARKLLHPGRKPSGGRVSQEGIMTIGILGNSHMSSVRDYVDVDGSTDVLTTTLANKSSSTGFTPVENTGDDSTDSTSSSTGTSISTAATLLSSLSTLQKQDPELFKETTSEIAASLHDAADDATDAAEKYQLNRSEERRGRERV